MRVLLFAGGNLFEQAFHEIKKEDTLIGVDRGAWELVKRGYVPDVAIGDFDSVSSEQKEDIAQAAKEIISCDAFDKDKTDTEMGLERAASMNPGKLMMFGVTGSRLDHTLANIFLLERSLHIGIDAEIRDAYNSLTLVTDSYTTAKDDYSYVSLLPLTEMVEGVTLNGFLYPLSEAVLKRKEPLGISNKIIEKEAKVAIKQGKLLVIKSKE